MLPDNSTSALGSLPLAARKRVDSACVRFEAGWKKGTPPPLPAFLESFSGNERSELLSELIKIELHYRRRAGQTPDPEQYLSLFPKDQPIILASFQSTLDIDQQSTPSPESQAVVPSVVTSLQDAQALALPGYEIHSLIGKGGMGMVYKATQAGLNRPVAIKMLLDEQGSEESQARFRREAETIAQIQHPNIIQVIEIGEAQGRLYFSMEYIKDGSLGAHLNDQPAPDQRRAAELVETLARAVHVAHQSGVVHRDLKPANILLVFDSNESAPGDSAHAASMSWWFRACIPKITDFGLAKRVTDPSQTIAGTVFGTPSYMAPEQADGDRGAVGPAVDVYSLGAILYELLTGRPPFKAATPMDTILQLLRREIVPPRKLNREVHRELEAICLKCLEKSPERRYGSAYELAADIRRYLEGKPTLARPLRWPRKTVRLALRYPLITTFLLVLIIGLCAAPTILWQLDPERPRAEMKRLLTQQSPYVVPDNPRDWPFRQVIGDPAPLVPGEQGVITCQTLGVTALWELTEDPMCDHYLFSAEVRHVAAGSMSMVGLYFGRHEQLSPQGLKQGTFRTLSFWDRGPLLVQQKDQSLRGQMSLESKLYELRQPPYYPNARVFADEFTVDLAKAAPWRTLRIEVSPQGVKASWDTPGEPGNELPFADSKRLMKALWAIQITSDKEVATVPTEFRPRGGLGLYVCGAKAEFRRVSLTPLPGGG